MAGAYLRLAQPAEAAKILEPLTNKFAGDYGVHANLGTAYHLLGRYTDAEREIARDLEINPQAHFGLEKYHLALLQYLIRDEAFRVRHVYVDEFTTAFLTQGGFSIVGRAEPGLRHEPKDKLSGSERDEASEEIRTTLQGRKTFSRDEFYKFAFNVSELAGSDQPPSYRGKWNLAEDSKLEQGVIYMAGLNSRQSACWVMLGILAIKHSDKNLTIAAFEKAIQLDSPQLPMLQAQIDLLREHISKARRYKNQADRSLALVVTGVLISIGICVLLRVLFLRVFRGMQHRGKSQGSVVVKS